MTGFIKELRPRAVMDDAVLDYEDWVEERGHLTPAASSVMASYAIEMNVEPDVTQAIADTFGVAHGDVTREMELQQADASVAMGESKMRISKKGLKRIINEEVTRALNELSGPTRNDMAAYYHGMDNDQEPNRGARMLRGVMTSPSYDFYTKDEISPSWTVDELVEHMTDSQVQEIWDNIQAADWSPGDEDYSMSAEDMAWGVY